eukprot:CAMPEP_0119157124 /NCGR_PEP_ID=MMETSP1310-20130426/52601_1 /TAXON_ID=464262 /ORGANISM="Genus nov. species nov., Strain RCC2339" /LENGTH=170 /DNA_ID=CAMNT_0007149739 /DNA_START=96 /DNA_END=609 /DNA_ORIENTATION=-
MACADEESNVAKQGGLRNPGRSRTDVQPAQEFGVGKERGRRKPNPLGQGLHRISLTGRALPPAPNGFARDGDSASLHRCSELIHRYERGRMHGVQYDGLVRCDAQARRYDPACDKIDRRHIQRKRPPSSLQGADLSSTMERRRSETVSLGLQWPVLEWPDTNAGRNTTHE